MFQTAHSPRWRRVVAAIGSPINSLLPPNMTTILKFGPDPNTVAVYCNRRPISCGRVTCTGATDETFCNTWTLEHAMPYSMYPGFFYLLPLLLLNYLITVCMTFFYVRCTCWVVRCDFSATSQILPKVSKSVVGWELASQLA